MGSTGAGPADCNLPALGLRPAGLDRGVFRCYEVPPKGVCVAGLGVAVAKRAMARKHVR